MEKSDFLNSVLADKQTALWYIGQVGFVIKGNGGYIAVDPYLSDYVDKNCSQRVAWKRKYGAPIQAEALDFLDVVLCTHSHCDHADPWTLPVISASNPEVKFIVPAPEVELISSYGIEKDKIIAAYADLPISIAGVDIIPIPSAHEQLHTDENGNYHELGYIIDDGSVRIFHSGDMCMYDGLIERLNDIDISILPINGRDYFRTSAGIIGNFDSYEAVTLAKLIKSDLLIPVHHDLYEANGASISEFADVLEKTDRGRRYHVFSPGERFIYMK